METKHPADILPIIAKELAGFANPAETDLLKKWIGKSDENLQYFKQVKNIWDASDRKSDYDSINTARAFEKVMKRIPEVPGKRSFWFYFRNVAAVLLLVAGIGTLLLIYRDLSGNNFSNEYVYNEVYTTYGTRSSLRLSDSTIVWLNSGSSLRYPVKFNDKKRQVFLKGEAYFEVKSDLSKPFIVETKNLQVKATGTKFNVEDYDMNSVTEVTLVSGKVFVNKVENKGSALISELNPNQHLIYNTENGEKTVNNVDSYRFIAWKDGKLIFRNDPLNDVLKEIGLMFNVDFELQGGELRNYRYHATFQDESLDEILKLLKLSAPIDYTEVKRNPLPDGSFPRKRVIIFPSKK